MRYRFGLVLCVAFVVFAIPGGVARHAEADGPTVVRVATLAPKGSSWMRVFNAWNKTLQKETNGTVKFTFYPSGSQGDERDFVRKMRAGQLDGAAISTTGLGMLVRPVLVLSVPGVFTEYDQLARVREQQAPQFSQMFEKAGYKLLGWSAAGKMRTFSKHEFLRPSDLKKLRPWAWKDDLIATEFMKAIGANPIGLGVPEVYPSLQTKIIDTLWASAIVTVAMQWYTQLKYVTAQNTGFVVAATVVKKEKFDELSEEEQAALVDTGRRAHGALDKSLRRDDEKAYKTILKRGITPVDTTTVKAEWDQASAKVTNNLAGRVYPKSLLNAVKGAAR